MLRRAGLELRLSAKSYMIIKIEQVEPRFHVFPGRVKLFHALGEHFERFHIAVRAALGKVGAPLLDLPWTALVRRVLLYPGQHLAVPFSGGKLSLEGIWRDPRKSEPMVIAWIIVFEFSGSS